HRNFRVYLYGTQFGHFLQTFQSGRAGKRQPANQLDARKIKTQTLRAAPSANGETMKKLLKNIFRFIAFRLGRAQSLYIYFCRPDGEEWAKFLKKNNFLFGMGENCAVQTNVVISDPKYVRLGNNVRLSGCALFGHD